MFDVTETDPEGNGAWSPVMGSTLIPIHSMVLPDGKVLAFGSVGATQTAFVYSLYDPLTGEYKVLPNTTGTNIFCSNMSIDPATGNVIIMGGDGQQNGGRLNSGINKVVVFDTAAQEIRALSETDPAFTLHQARWYGTSINLANGEILMVGGRDESFDGSSIPEIYNHETGFRQLPGAEIRDIATEGPGSLTGTYYYPHVWQISNGDVIVIESGGPDHEIYRMNTEGAGSVELIGRLPFDTRNLTSSMMYGEDQVIVASTTGQVWKADLSAPVPRWEIAFTVTDEDGSGLVARTNGTFVPLPDGKIAYVGGSSSAGLLADSVASGQKSIFIWDPETGETTFTEQGAEYRMYHSSAVLMPTGQIYVGGGGAPGPYNNTDFEVFTPSELFDADGNYNSDRPQILRAPTNVEAGSTIRITVDDTSDIDKITFIKSGAATHARNADARFLELDHRVVSSGVIEVDIPAGNVALPGVWMLFAVDKAGASSIASMTGVDMVDIVGTPGLGNNPTVIYNIDDEQIDGAFALAVQVRFDDIEGGAGQRVFDFGNGAGADRISFGQKGASDDMEFVIVQDGTTHRVVAENAIVEGEDALWRVGVDPDGIMRIVKNGEIVAEGQGVVPKDVDRKTALIGESQDGSADLLLGLVADLKIANYGNFAELDPSNPQSPCQTTGEAVCLCDKLVPDVDDTPGNDAPKVFDEYSVLQGTVTELTNGSRGENETVLKTTGIVAFADADTTDTHTATVTPRSANPLGTFTIAAPTTTTEAKTGNVTWNFAVNDRDLDTLKEGEEVVQSYDITIDDGQGGRSTSTVSLTLRGTDDSVPTEADYIVVDAITTTSGDDTIALGDNIRLMNGADFRGGQNSLTVGNYFELRSGKLDFDSSDGAATFQTGLRARLFGGDIDMDEGGIRNTLVLGKYSEFSFIDMDGNGAGTVNTIRIGANSASDAGMVLDSNGTSSDWADVTLELGYGVVIDGAIDADGNYANHDFTFAERVDIGGPLYLGAANSRNTVTFGEASILRGPYYGSSATGDTLSFGRNWDIQGPVYLYGGDDVLTLGETDKDPGLTYFYAGAGNDTLNLSVEADKLASFKAAARAIGWTETAAGQWSAGARDLNWNGMYLFDFETVNVEVVGLNRAPTIVADGTDDTGALTEFPDGDPKENTGEHLVNGAIQFADPDEGDTHTASLAPADASYLGEMRITDPDPMRPGLLPWAFTVADADLDALDAGETRTQTYQVTITDKEGASVRQTLTVTLTGAADAAPNVAPVVDVAASALAANVAELADGATGEGTFVHEATGTIAYSDANADDTHTASVTPKAAGYRGTLTLGEAKAGELAWTFQIADGALDDLDAGETLTQDYVVTLSDGRGGTTSQTVTVTLTGAADAAPNVAPVIDVAASALAAGVSELEDGASSEGTFVHQATGTIAYNDANAADTHTASVTPKAAGYRGTLTLGEAKAGELAWTFDIGDGALDDLDAGETLTQDYVVTLSDGRGGTASQTLTVTLTGAADGDTPPPPINVIAAPGGYVAGTAGADRFVGTEAPDVFYGGRGDDIYEGGGGYNQIDYDGNAADYSFTRNADGTVTVSHPVYGEDRLSDIGGFWFRGEAKWYAFDELAPPRIDDGSLNVIESAGGYVDGTVGADRFVGSAGTDIFYGGRGDDIYEGGEGYNQVDYDGKAADYSFTRNADGTVTVSHPVYGEDRLSDIGGFWFRGEAKWYALSDLVSSGTKDGYNLIEASGQWVNGSAADDWMVGTDADEAFWGGKGDDVILGGGGYNQADYDGFAADYTVVRNEDGTVTVTHPEYGTDTLSDVTGFWFRDEAAWYDLADLLPARIEDGYNVIEATARWVDGTDAADKMIGTDADEAFWGGKGDDLILGGGGYNQVDYDGGAADYVFTRNADGTVTVTKPEFGTDTLTDIGGVWFRGDAEWFGIEELAGPLPEEGEAALTSTVMEFFGEDLTATDASGAGDPALQPQPEEQFA